MKIAMKNTELKLLSELMKNSRRSDRELAKAVGVSQPTISRAIRKLEKEGYIKEYTIIPDFKKLGFQMMSVILTKFKKESGQEGLEQIRKKVREEEKKEPSSILMGVGGMGIDSDRVVVLLSEDYSEYSRYISKIKQHPLVDVQEVKSFIIDLTDESQFLPLTLSSLARYIEKKQSKEKKEA
jgi:DNA-binding Lrp family transcriptional regulator